MRLRLLTSLLLFTASLSAAEPKTGDGYSIPELDHAFSFPADLGSHPGFKIEWWYITGHLFTPGNRRFGFQATFFRFAGAKDAAKGTPAFSNGELFLAHMALTDSNGKNFISEERINRAGWDAHAAVGALDVANGGWSLTATNEAKTLHLKGSIRAEASFDLTLSPQKPLVVFGEHSVSKKGDDPAAASYYLTFSRLKAAGQLSVAGEKLTVSGEAWMDHEISSSQLSGGEVGWDWVSIQLKDRPWEIMLYRLRHPDGTPDRASKLQWVDPSGRAVTQPFSWDVLSRWKSPRTGAVYPSRIKLATTDPASHQPVVYTLVPILEDQELNGTVAGAYWEGACRVLDEHDQEVGSAYLELTGYSHKLGL
jgi:predicted secreted hydrolase